jgi:lysophospholipase L1-like esterase
MSPRKVLYFVLLVFSMLGVVMIIFPEDGLRIGKNTTLHFPSFSELFLIDTSDSPDIGSLVDREAMLDSLESVLNTSDSVLLANADELIKSVHRLEFGSNGNADLHRFFSKLSGSSKRLIRVMHYGDSQIEGDRITAFLRNKLQSRFGGSGPGLIPLVQPYDYSFSFVLKPGPGWRRYAGFGTREKSVPHNGYGAMVAFARFSPFYNDSLPNDSVMHRASVEIRKAGSAYALAKTYSVCRLYYGNNRHPVIVRLSIDGGDPIIDTLPAGKGMRVMSWHASPASYLSLDFSGFDSPDVYGLALEAATGISVDNIALRGSSGTIFSGMNSALLATMYDRLGAELFILQFGGNVMPAITNEKQCKDYGNYFYNQLMTLRRLKPDASIIVIGPSDMSYKEKDRYVTYPLLEKVRDALRDATHKAGGSFWDMYSAMGGKNSMPGWVSASPPLAAYDYVHFSPKGAQIIANMFYNAFILEYTEYLKQTIKNPEQLKAGEKR